jgi:hypothetical protein
MTCHKQQVSCCVPDLNFYSWHVSMWESQKGQSFDK